MATSIRKVATPVISVLGPSLGGIYLIPNPWLGALLWIGLLQEPRIAAFAVVGLVVAEGISRVFHMTTESPIDGGLKANGLLGAAVAAWLTGHSDLAVEVQITVAVVSAVVATLLTAAATRALAKTGLPTLVLGYCIVAVVLGATFKEWELDAIAAMDWLDTPTDPLSWFVAFFRTIGQLVYSPTIGMGVVVAVVVFLWSRAAFITGVVGWIAGVTGGVAIAAEGGSFYWMPVAYNYFLSGMALGAVFFQPGRASLVMAAIGGFSAAVFVAGLQHLLPDMALGYLPVATILTVWTAIFALSVSEGQAVARRNDSHAVPPEEAWWRAEHRLRRWGPDGAFLVVPIAGRARVSQGVDGELSHAGLGRHALDFQGEPAPGKTTRDDAKVRNPAVFAPAPGIVERMRNDVPDNPLGTVNYAENWGNHVVIRLDQGDWALLAHLKNNSVSVYPGMRVEYGTQLGIVGNSGRSPLPHVHVQVQQSAELGSPSVPFRLANFLFAAVADAPLLQWRPAAVPKQGSVVAAALPNPAVHAVLTSIAPGTALWSVQQEGHVPRPFQVRNATASSSSSLRISLDAAGRHRIRETDGSALLAVLDPDAWRVLEVDTDAAPPLKLFALAIPSVPYAAVRGMVWYEPASVAFLGASRWFGLLIAPYLRDPFVRLRCECKATPDGPDGRLTIETRLEKPWSWLPTTVVCSFDRVRGPVHLEAAFQKGTVTLSLLSFEPGMPFDDNGE